ncbi:hypothetical protein [Dysgonomonas sp. PFB1-18]|nr:hypothetical protein [Dysgonomonas sp. PFB1-18]
MQNKPIFFVILFFVSCTAFSCADGVKEGTMLLLDIIVEKFNLLCLLLM